MTERAEEIRRRWAALGPDDPWGQDVEVISVALAQAERELAEYEGVEGRCKVGHNKKFSYELEGEPGCVACERDAARAEVERLKSRTWDDADKLKVTEADLTRVRAALDSVEKLIGRAVETGNGVYLDQAKEEARAALEGR